MSLKNMPHRLPRLCSISELEAIFSIVFCSQLSFLISAILFTPFLICENHNIFIPL